jgi:parallel beta-helix repeat protein
MDHFTQKHYEEGRRMKTHYGILFFVLLLGILLSSSNTRSVRAIGAIYIEADGSINPPEAPVSSLDRVTYLLTGNITDSVVIERNNIVIDGAGHTVEGDGTGNGFSLVDVINVTIKNTRISACFEGIRLFNSSDNMITGNSVIGSSYEGIGLYFSSDCIITANNITNNQIGIAFYDSSNNSIAHNNIAANSYQAYTESSVNVWDDGSKGNYWSDYNGTDSNQDGIGDTPYTIDTDNQDRYPLMKPDAKPGLTTDINKDGAVNILDIFLIAKSFKAKRGFPGWNPDADIDGNGTIDILDIVAVALDFGKAA